MHVVMRVQPDRYIHPHQCTDGVHIQHHATIRAHLSKNQLDAVIKVICKKYGNDVKIVPRRQDNREADITLAYSQHRLQDSESVIEFENWLVDQMRIAQNNQLVCP